MRSTPLAGGNSFVSASSFAEGAIVNVAVTLFFFKSCAIINWD
jgi:hypothetical protein